MAITTEDLVKQLRARDQDWRERGGDMMTYGPGDELSRMAANTIENMQSRLDRWEPKISATSALSISAQQKL